MVSGISKDTSTMISRLLTELSNLDSEMLNAQKSIEQAKADYEIVSTKFAGLRDTLRKYGRDPYLLGHESGWTITSDGVRHQVTLPSKGAFRYLRMVPEEAVNMALTQLKQPYGLGELVQLLRNGGADWANDGSVMRIVTAKLGNTVGKTKDGKFYLRSQFQPDESDTEDSDS